MKNMQQMDFHLAIKFRIIDCTAYELHRDHPPSWELFFYSNVILAVSAVPLLAVYVAQKGQTAVLLPSFFRQFSFSIFGFEILSSSGMLQLGPLYYLFLIFLIIFCLNSINILAGVNGLESGQARLPYT